MSRAFIRFLAITASVAGCERGVPQRTERSRSSVTASASVVPSASATAPPSLRATLAPVIERWVRAQNEGSMARYRELYAQDFTGVKRVGDQAAEMGREAWLEDRQRLSLKTPRVEISDLRFYAKGDVVVAEFRQKWTTASFADEGTKLLTLLKRNDAWQIVREAMSSSRVLSEEERASASGGTGQCESLELNLDQRERAGELWRFADISGGFGPAKWAKVSSWEEAKKKAPDGEVWLSATVVSDGEWLLAFTSDFGRTGDSAVLTEQCYRANGSLAKLEDAFRTFNTGRGLGEDVRIKVFDEEGKLRFTTRKTYLMETGAPLDPGEMMGEAASAPNLRVSSLPYFTLLPEEVRSRYGVDGAASRQLGR